MRNTVTIIVDASHCPDTLAGGYGVWIACDRGRAPFKGPLVGATNSGTAETMAICNAVWHGLKEGLIYRGDKVLIQTDCQTAIKVYKEHNWKYSLEGDAFQWLEKQVELYSLDITFKHIKGHSRVQDSRSMAQRHCDDRAKEAMRLERSRINIAKESAKVQSALGKLVRETQERKAAQHSLETKQAIARMLRSQQKVNQFHIKGE